MLWGRVKLHPWPLPSAGPELGLIFLFWNCWKLWDDFRDFLCLFFGLPFLIHPQFRKWCEGKPAMCWRPPVSLLDFLWFLCPQTLCFAGTRIGECPGWSGCWSQLRALKVYMLQDQPLQFSLPQQLSTTFKQTASAFTWTLLALLDRSAGLLQITPAITYALIF